MNPYYPADVQKLAQSGCDQYCRWYDGPSNDSPRDVVYSLYCTLAQILELSPEKTMTYETDLAYEQGRKDGYNERKEAELKSAYSGTNPMRKATEVKEAELADAYGGTYQGVDVSTAVFDSGRAEAIKGLLVDARAQCECVKAEEPWTSSAYNLADAVLALCDVLEK